MKLKSTFVSAVVLAAAMGVAEAKDNGKPGEYDVHDCRNKQCQDVNTGNPNNDNNGQNGNNGNDGSQANNGGNGKGYGYGYGGQGGNGGQGGVGNGGKGGVGHGGNSDSHSNADSHSNSHSNSDSHSNSNSNAHGGNANANGGRSDASANANGGNANAHGGQSDANANAQGGHGGQANAEGGNVGDVNVSNSTTTHFNQAKQVGIAPNVFLQPTGDCGEGWSISTGFIGGSIGGGKTKQNEVCLSQKAAQAIMNTGLVRGDDGMIAGGLRTLANIHSEIDSALETIGNNMIECADAPKPASIVLLAQKTPYCKPKM